MRYFLLSLLWVFIIFGVYLAYKQNLQNQSDALYNKAEEANNIAKENKNSFTIIKIPNWHFDESINTFVIDFEEVKIPKTKAVLNQTYKHLFLKRSDKYTLGQWNDMKFDKVVLKNGIANLYLKGKPQFDGELDKARFVNEIEAAAFVFDNVKQLNVFLNNKPFDYCIFDSKGDCVSITPWVKEK